MSINTFDPSTLDHTQTFERKFYERFTLTCKKCGSSNVALSVYHSEWYSEDTGGDPASLTIGCNDCKQNDLYETL